MKKFLKTTAIIFLGLIAVLATITITEQLPQEEIPLSTDPDFDFVAWSNTVSSQEAELLLKDFINLSFNSWEETETWLIAQDFRIFNPYPKGLPETDASFYDVKKRPLFFTSIGWSAKERDIPFTDISELAQGINIIFIYTKEPFIMHSVYVDVTIF